MSKKENYTFPNLEALLADSSATKVDLMNGKIDASPFRQVGVEICRTLVVSHDAQTVGEEYMDRIATYNEMQPELGQVGIIGPDFRFKKNSSAQLCFSAGLTLESMQIGLEVVLTMMKPFCSPPSLEEDTLPVPSAFFCTPADGKSHWYHIPAPDDSPLVALVALTEVYVTIIPHSVETTAQWDALTFGGQSNPLKKQVFCLLSAPMCEQLDGPFAQTHCTFRMTPGQIMVMHRGMPCKFSGAPCTEPDGSLKGEEPYVVKSVVREILKKGNRRKSQYTQALSNKGSFPMGAFGEAFPHSLLKKFTEEPAQEVLFQVASAEDVFEFTAMSKKVVVAPAKKAAPAPAPAPEPEEASSASSSSSSSTTPSSSSSSSSSSSAAKVSEASVQKTTKATVAAAASKSAGLEAAYKMHDELRTKISELDKRVWDVKFEKNANEKREKFETLSSPNDFSSVELKQYKTALDTLSGRLDTALQNAKELVAHVQKLERIRVMLEQWESLPAEFKHEINRRDGKKKKYNEYSAPGVNLVAKAKKIQELLDEVLELETAIEERKAKAPSVSKSSASAAPSAAAVARKVLSASDIIASIDPVDEEALEPDERKEKGGDDGWFAPLTSASRNLKGFVQMGVDLKNDAVSGYVRRFQESYKEITDKIKNAKGKPDFIDVAKLIAYTDLLDTICDRCKKPQLQQPVANGVGAVEPVLEKKKRVKCGSIDEGDSGCGEKRDNYDNSGYCRSCWYECYLVPLMAHYGEREDALERQSQDERKAIRTKNVEGEEPGNEEEGPLTKKLAEYKTFHEDFHNAADALEKPNPTNLKAFKKLQERANELLPEVEGESDGDYDEDEDEEDEGLRAMIVDDDEEEFSGDEDESPPSRRDRKNLKKRDRSASPERKNGHSNVASLALDVLRKLPVEAEHKKIYDLWGDDSKHQRLRHHLDDIKDSVKTIWRVRVKVIGTDVEHVFGSYTDEKVAKYEASQTQVVGVMTSVVERVDIDWSN